MLSLNISPPHTHTTDRILLDGCLKMEAFALQISKLIGHRGLDLTQLIDLLFVGLHLRPSPDRVCPVMLCPWKRIVVWSQDPVVAVRNQAINIPPGWAVWRGYVREVVVAHKGQEHYHNQKSHHKLERRTDMRARDLLGQLAHDGCSLASCRDGKADGQSQCCHGENWQA